jgi:uncharacterized membrane protein YphA (DoxX/SURF4 family)
MYLTLSNFLQIIIAIGLLNVWLIRFNKSTPFRGGNATSLKEEFSSYGLPAWFSYLVGALKISSAIFLILGLWFPQFVLPVVLLVSTLMLGAIFMHIKIKDPIIKSVPAFSMIVLCVSVMGLIG